MSDVEHIASGFRFLVVDREDVARSVQLLLQADDVVITETDSARACERIAEADRSGAPFDVVLCRFDIDASCGQSVYRATHACESPPLFIYMARHCDEASESSLPRDGILIKPFSGEEVEDLMVKIAMARSRERTRQLLSNNYN